MTDNFLHHTRRLIRHTEMLSPGLFSMGLKPMRTLCKLILLLYFAVFSAMPLSSIHVDHLSSVSLTHGESGAPTDSFLIVLHEFLALHFRDQGDHTLFPPRSLLRSRPAGAPSSDYDVSGTAIAGNQAAGCGCLYPPAPVVQYSHVQDNDSPYAFAGYHYFCSSLSPPSA